MTAGAPLQTMPPQRAFRWACCMDLRALKPGNVAASRPGHGMSGRDFLVSARRSAPVLCAPGSSLGQRLRDAAAATREAVGCNTNLGILLLCAPLLMAAQRRSSDQGLQAAVADVLGQADRTDTRYMYQAIRIASPGGLGDAPKHDVRQPVDASVLEVMGEAAHRDRIAAQYVNGFVDLLGPQREQLARDWRRWQSLNWATTALYLRLLAEAPDSHTLRRQGAPTARWLMEQAAPLAAAVAASDEPGQLRGRLLAFDRELHAAGINPGTCADLTVATICGLLLEPDPGAAGQTARDAAAGRARP
ncbi:triphosphoribosyl-dephospho-CoA synthase [Methylonatrum kenyense]|uniref:triphosphoribosyl-dephospho-CoA synthase n=1 Tax=Methylonatrum kenyense TaxID=455253 RepID=UPI0020C07F73|nr:triphosphoribosyl-dephospho-CoA synthase [Methylonatrum kenyense]MCK8515430.1 triphosphoribosyl-dephospho-CoA synthase [Methylonatrum kenyense]